MSDVNDNPRKKDGGKTSGASRRIVVQDLPPEDLPKVQGRKLSTPADLDDQSRRYESSQKPVLDAPSRAQGSFPSARAPGLPQQPAAQNRKTKTTEPINVKRLVLIITGMIALPLFLGAVVLIISVVRNKRPGASARRDATPAVVPRQIGTMSTTEVSTPSPEASPQASPVTGSAIVEATEIRSMTAQLASQISQKSGYEFAPELVELIRSRTSEYNSEKALIGARQFRREINKSFRDEGLNPLVGYALAMSRSKFDLTLAEKGIGIWQIPLSVARSQGYVSANENGAKLRIPETSAQISASYTKQLLSAFDADDFMYAIACFGLNLEEAGRLQSRLIAAAPDSRNRRDIMRMIRAGVLTGDQVDNIARFFAAGIVGENPQRFGLTGSQPFSSLY